MPKLRKQRLSYFDGKFKYCTNKKCKNIGVKLPIERFHVRKTSKSGYQGFCKDCISEYQKKLYNEKQLRLYYEETKKKSFFS